MKTEFICKTKDNKEFMELLRESEIFYPYAEFPEHLAITFSQPIIGENIKNGKKILVSFKQPNKDGSFKEARYQLPNFKMIYNCGFTLDEQQRNEDILRKNANLIIKYSKIGGVKLK